MKVNMIQMTRENIALHGYVSDDAKSIYLELYGLSWGHLALKDTVTELRKSPKEGGSEDDLKNWHKFCVDSKNIFEDRNNIIDVGSLTSRHKLSPGERKFFRDVIDASMKKLYDFLKDHPWVSINGLPVWDGDQITNWDWKSRTDYRGHACSFIDISVFGDRTLSNYRFDNGSTLTSVIDNIPTDFSEYEGSDKIFNLSSSDDREVDYIERCEIYDAIRRWRYNQKCQIVEEIQEDISNTKETEETEDAIIALAKAVYGSGPYVVDIEKYKTQYDEIYKSWDDGVSMKEKESEKDYKTLYYKIHIKLSLKDFTALKDHGYDKVPYWSARGILKDMVRPYKNSWLAYRRFIDVMSIPDNKFMDFDSVVLYGPLRENVATELLKRNRHDGRDCRITEIPKAKYDEIHQSYYIELQKSVMNERR